MLTPERFEELMLDYLYQLLDEVDTVAMREYLQANAEARARLERARQLLEQAARQSFAHVNFAPPPSEVAAPAATPTVRSRSFRRRILPWLVAASVVVVVGLGAIPIVRVGTSFWDARHTYEVARAKLRQIEQEHQALVGPLAAEQDRIKQRSEEIQQAIQTLAEEKRDRLKNLEEELSQQQIILEVSGPEAIQPGAPNHFQIATLGRARRNPVAARLNIRLLGENDAVLYEEKDVASQGLYTLHIPPDLPVRPNVPLALDITASGKGQLRGELTERLPWAAPRYVTHLATDKPLYQPGQTIYFRSLTLNRSNLQPPQEDFHLIFTLTNPSGAEIHRLEGTSQVVQLTNDAAAKKLLGPDLKPIRGIGLGEFTLPEEAEGGEYILTVSEANHRFPAEKRKILVSRYTPDRLDKEMDFHRSTYGPGDEVIVQCKVRRAGNTGPVEGIQIVAAVAQIDEHAVVAQPLGPIDVAGRVRLRLQLPKTLERGRGTLTVTFADGGAVESIQKPIPILLKKVFVDFFPESGELVAGVPNRVYFQARTSLDRPAQLRGRLLNSKNELVTAVETLSDDNEPGVNQGHGVFQFVPSAGEQYHLKIDSPTGIDAPIPLLSERIQIRTNAVALSIPDGVTKEGQPLQVELHSVGRPRQLLVGAYSRGVLLEHQRVRVEPGQPTRVALALPKHVGGVVRVTAFEEQNGTSGRAVFVPRAERLVYRQSAARLNLTVQPDRKRYVPGDKVSVKLTATDETGKPARAIGLISVVDQSIVVMADEKTARSMPTHFALIGEVRKPEDLEYADFLFTDHPKAAVALDLLLGVQGWRRFAEQSPEQFQRQEGQEAERVLVLTGQAGQRVFNSIDDRRQAIERELKPRFNALFEELAEISQKEEELHAKKLENQDAVAAIEEKLDRARGEFATALDQLQAQEAKLGSLGRGLLMVVLGLVVLGLTIRLVIVFSRAVQQRRQVLAFGSIASVILLVLGTLWLSYEFISPGSFRRLADGQQVAALAPKNARDLPAIGGEDRNRLAMEGAAPAAMMAQPPAVAEQFAAPQVAAARPGVAGVPQAPMAADAMRNRGAESAADRKGMTAGPGMTRRKTENLAWAPPYLKGVDEGQIGQLKAEKLRPMRSPKADRPAAAMAPLTPGLGGRAAPGVAAFREPSPDPRMAPGAPRIEILPEEPSVDAGGIPAPPPPPFVVREYSHARPSHATAETRSDFTETVYWNPVALFDREGQATASFQLSDSVTSFRVLVAAHTLDGRLGQTIHLIESRKPFSVETRLPVEMTNSDRLELPIQLRNDTDSQRAAVLSIQAESFRLGGVSTDQLEYAERILLTPNQATRRLLRLQPAVVEGSGVVRIQGSSEPFATDRLERRIQIVADGFPVVDNVSGTFAPESSAQVVNHEFNLPPDYVPGTLRVHAQIFPSPVADLQQALEGMLREPFGCFEQSSSGNYPNTLITSYLQERGQTNSSVFARANELLQRGYERLVSFECIKPGGAGREGYEWFGGEAPPHEALTAYGLLQFMDMSKVYPVDQEMLKRTRAYLLSRRLPEGGFQRNRRAIDQFGRAPQHITDAYIIWALSATGDEDLEKDIGKLLQNAAVEKDPYCLSLLALSLANRGKLDRAHELLRKLKPLQAEDGGVDGATTSITCSGGRDLRIETTALALLGWIKVNRPDEFQQPITKAFQWIIQQRGGYGGFGSTQATILALKALLEYTKANARIASDGELRLFVGNRLSGQVRFLADRSEPITLEASPSEDIVRPGKNICRLELDSKAALPFTLAWTYSRRVPPSSTNCPLRLTAALNQTEVTEGDGVRLNVKLANTTEKGLPMTVAILGLPAGLRVPEDMRQLREMARLRRGEGDQLLPGEISFFEIRGRELVLYWRDLPPRATVDLNIDLRADFPGEFRGPASRAYLYYNADDKYWVEPLSVRIKPQAP
jgi:tetratricopeptide (TPR) repeat protein/predicted nuclease with TOPRIM domain